MAKKKGGKSSGNISNGGRQKANLAHEAKRQAKFAAKRESGNSYIYKKNPYDPKTQPEDWAEETYNRRMKNKSSKIPYARLTSIFAKLDNQLAAEKLAAKEKSIKHK